MAFPLMRLEPEIRERIYDFLVLDEAPIEVATFKVAKGSPATTRGRVTCIAGPFHCDYYPLRKAAVDWLGRPASPNKFAIAQVNRRIALEARPMIYGDNAFTFDNVSDMETFVRSLELAWTDIRKLPDVRQYLRDVRIDGALAWNTRYSRLFLSFWRMTSLESITLNYLCIESAGASVDDWRLHRTSMVWFVTMITGFLKQWQRINRASKGERAVLDLVRVVDNGYCRQCRLQSKPCGVVGPGAARRAADRLKVAADLRLMIAQKLNIVV